MVGAKGKVGILALFMALAAHAQPRLVRLTVLDDTGRPPAVFWEHGRLCIPEPPGPFGCHDVANVPRSEPTRVTKGADRSRPRLDADWRGARLWWAPDGTVRYGDVVTSVGKLRCGLGRLRSRGIFRYVHGEHGELAVLALEEDDTMIDTARFDVAALSDGPFRRLWVVLFAADACPDESATAPPLTP